MLKEETPGVLCPEGFIYVLQAGILGELPGEDLYRIFIRFLGMSFSVLMD